MDGQAIAVIALIVGTLWWYNKTKISPENQKSIPERGDGTRKEITVQTITAKGHGACSLSHYCTKLETWMRFQGFKYTKEKGDFTKAPLGKMPVIEHNAQLIPDSGFIIEYLSNTFPEQIIKLTPEQQALSTVVTYFCDKHWSLQIPYNRFVDSQKCTGFAPHPLPKYGATTAMEYFRNRNQGWPIMRQLAFDEMPTFLKAIIPPLIRARVQQTLRLSGMAEFSRKDQMRLFKEGAAALSTLMGDKKYFTGDQPSEADALVFGCVDQMLHDPSLRDLGAALRSYPNLIEHAKRIRAEYFPETLPMEADVVKE